MEDEPLFPEFCEERLADFLETAGSSENHEIVHVPYEARLQDVLEVLVDVVQIEVREELREYPAYRKPLPGIFHVPGRGSEESVVVRRRDVSRNDPFSEPEHLPVFEALAEFRHEAVVRNRKEILGEVGLEVIEGLVRIFRRFATDEIGEVPDRFMVPPADPAGERASYHLCVERFVYALVEQVVDGVVFESWREYVPLLGVAEDDFSVRSVDVRPVAQGREDRIEPRFPFAVERESLERAFSGFPRREVSGDHVLLGEKGFFGHGFGRN